MERLDVLLAKLGVVPVDAQVAREALLFSIAPRRAREFSPQMLRPYLPRDLKWRFKSGEPIYEFFARWSASRDAVAARTTDAPTLFRDAARHLRDHGGEAGLHADDALLERGLVLWAPPGGVPRARVGGG